MAGELDPITLDATLAPTIFKAHEYVQIKAEMLAGDEAIIQNATGKITPPADGSTPEISLQLGDAMLATLQTMIVGWNVDRKIKAPDGSVTAIPLPYNSANVTFLPRRISNYVYNYMNKLYQEDALDAQINFMNSAAEPIAAS